MRRIILALVLLFSIPVLGEAQRYDEHRGQAYAYFSPGATSPGGTGTFQVGGGGEGLLYRGLGIGGELGYLAPWHDTSHGLGIVSADGSYHFGRSGRVVPFVESGYTLFFRSGTSNGVNFGVGANYWFREHVGLRVEFRDQLAVNLGDVTSHNYGFRLGLSFR